MMGGMGINLLARVPSCVTCAVWIGKSMCFVVGTRTSVVCVYAEFHYLIFNCVLYIKHHK